MPLHVWYLSNTRLRAPSAAPVFMPRTATVPPAPPPVIFAPSSPLRFSARTKLHDLICRRRSKAALAVTEVRLVHQFPQETACEVVHCSKRLGDQAEKGVHPPILLDCIPGGPPYRIFHIRTDRRKGIEMSSAQGLEIGAGEEFGESLLDNSIGTLKAKGLPDSHSIWARPNEAGFRFHRASAPGIPNHKANDIP